MEKTALIWDLDGTLLDSYDIIVTSLYKAYREFHIELDQREILQGIITDSVRVYITKMEPKTGIAFDDVNKRFSEINDSEKLNIKPMKNAAEILCWLQEQDIPNYVFTHKGASTRTVLKNIGMLDFFEDIVTGKDGFPRKPDPSALNYLIEKHKLNKNSTFYVGDRSLDIECANNAGIKSILFLPESSAAHPTGNETFIVKDLLEIKEIFQ